MAAALEDIWTGLGRWRLWTLLAWEEFRARYHRTFFGPVWVTASFLAFISVKIFIFGALSGADGDYFVAHLTLGFMVWTYIANVVTGGAASFVNSRNWILGVRSPLSIFIMQDLAVAFINFFFVGLASVTIALIYQPFQLEQAATAVLGVVLLMFSLFWVQLFLAVAGVFVRDAIPLTATAMRIAFFLTPILWLPSALGARAAFVDYNPFTHYVAIVRAPLLDGAATPLNYAVVVGLTLLAIVVSLSALSLGRTRIPSLV